MKLACLDLEGVLIPEIWINFAEATGIDALRATTRDDTWDDGSEEREFHHFEGFSGPGDVSARAM